MLQVWQWKAYKSLYKGFRLALHDETSAGEDSITLEEVFKKKTLTDVPLVALRGVINKMRWVIPPLTKEDVGFSLSVMGMGFKDACPRCFALRYCGRKLLSQVSLFLCKT